MKTNGAFLIPQLIEDMIRILVIFLFLNGCTEYPISEQRGKTLFYQTHLGDNRVIGCISCHTVKAEAITVGPSLYGVAHRAELMQTNTSARQYLKQSIINPDAFIVSGYQPAVMYAHYGDELSHQQVNDLVNYLLTLK